MSLHRWAAKPDANQVPIVAVLREAGAGVWLIRWPYDLLVAFRGTLFLMGCKMPGKDFSDSQRITLRLLEACGCTAVAVHDAEEALRTIGAV